MKTQAYKGYLINIITLTGEVFVEKEGCLICRPNSVEDAKRQIDELVS